MLPLELLQRRHSVRSFIDSPLPDKAAKALKAEISFICSHEAGLHFQLIENDPAPFAGFKRSYGFFRNVRHYISAAIDTDFEHAEERAGFYAEEIVMKCVEMGLGTCFVGATFSRDSAQVQMRASWKLPFIVAIGEPLESRTSPIARLTTAIIHRKTPSVAILYDSSKGLTIEQAIARYPELPDALRALAAAPSAMNRRPVTISADDEHIYATVKKMEGFTPVDLGIAKFNIAAAIGGEWEWGNGAPLLLTDE